MNAEHETVLDIDRVCFAGKAFLCSPLWNTLLSRPVVNTNVSFSRGIFLLLSSANGFPQCSSQSLFALSNSSFTYRFACFFRLALALIWFPPTEISSMSRYLSSATTFSIHQSTYCRAVWLNRCLKF